MHIMPDNALTTVGTVRRWLALILEIGAAVAFMVMAVSLILQIFFRYVFAVVAPWTEELARFACIWAVFLGTAVCFEEGTHIKLDYITARASGKTIKRILLLANIFVTSTFLVVVFYGSILLVEVGWADVATTVPVRMGMVYLVVPVSMACIALFGILRFIEAVTGGSSRGVGRMPCTGTTDKGSQCS
jgi:TRAP-type C4-dicarboxylate transport system permease small subunit